jgi:hypothetical protein
MSRLTQSVRVLICMLPFVSVAACRFDKPAARDARSIYGCYTAPGAPSFSLSPAGMRVIGTSTAVPFRYEYAKVGYGIKVPLDASRSDGRSSFTPSSDDYFYRMTPSDAGPSFMVTFNPEGTVVTYSRSEDARCPS